ncbi:cardiotrophin-like cytokine factor 1, partial [Cetorhinus maximus]
IFLVFLVPLLLNVRDARALRLQDGTISISIQKTYELTKYLERQLQTLTINYMDYLGPPFDSPDFDPPRLNRTEAIPSATLEVSVWRNLDDRLRLTENLRAYGLLLRCLGDVNRDLANPALRHTFQHFCTSVQGLTVSISGLVTSLGYPQPPTLPPPPGAQGLVPASSDFLRKLDHFWLMRELEGWLLRSAKDFNRLKKRLGGLVVRLDYRGL